MSFEKTEAELHEAQKNYQIVVDTLESRGVKLEDIAEITF